MNPKVGDPNTAKVYSNLMAAATDQGLTEMVFNLNGQTKKQTITWGFIFLFAFGCFIYEAQHVINEYIQQPYVIKTDPVYLDSQRVPDTIVCPTHPLDTERLRQANFTEFEIAQVHMVFTPDWYTVPNGWYVNTGENFVDIDEKIKGMGFTWEGFLLYFGQDCSDYLKHCMMNWHIKDCCSMVEPVLHRYFGKCFAFKNLDQIANQTAAFLFGGLVVLAKTEAPQKILFGNFVRGLSVEIAHKYTGQNTYEILPVSPDEITQITLVARKEVRQPDRLGGCLDLENWSSRMTPHYCWNKAVIECCNCSLIGYFKDTDVPACWPQQYAFCDADYITILSNRCVQKMSFPACEEWIYDPNILRSKLDLDGNYFHTQKEYGFAKPSWLADRSILSPDEIYSMINVYFTRMGYTEVKEVSTYSIHLFISSIGGHLSLFLGASIISLVQLAIYIPSLCFNKKRAKNGGVMPVSNIQN